MTKARQLIEDIISEQPLSVDTLAKRFLGRYKYYRDGGWLYEFPTSTKAVNFADTLNKELQKYRAEPDMHSGKRVWVWSR